MPQPIIGREIIRLETTDSTNTYLMSLAAQGAQEGLVVIADRQTAGRGRRGRSFQSTDGLGLYMSVLVRPNLPAIRVPELTSWTAVAVCDAIEAAFGKRPQIKWVNDIIADGRKLGGILTELALNPDGTLSHVVIGIGINANHRQDDFDPELRDMAISLSQWLGGRGNRDRIVLPILTALDEMYRRFPHDRQEYLSRYRADCITLGHSVLLTTPAQTREAMALGIDENFRLLVELPDGTREALSAGEASVRGQNGYL